MVHIKRVELSHFKSFGGTTKVPILPGFTVISGPNGSGKSNILDALLFCLGLASSKGMRAERLPDLINHNKQNGKGSEAIVSVTFDLTDLGDLAESIASIENMTPISGEDLAESEAETNGNGHHLVESSDEEAEEVDIEPKKVDNQRKLIAIDNNGSLEWTVTRRLKVGRNGNYSSTFYINGQVATTSEVHEQLEKLRIYPEGYNVVLQGDVTRIITMNSRERREIIDELAGVAAFDRKIQQTKKTLDKVQEREERCQIIAQELIANRDRLAADRVKAEKYRKLKASVQEKKQLEIVLVWQALQQQHQEITTQLTEGEAKAVEISSELARLDTDIAKNTAKLAQLNDRVKALGEDEQLAVASELATQKAQRDRLQQQQAELITISQQQELSLVQTQQNLAGFQQEIDRFSESKNRLETETIPELEKLATAARETLANSKETANEIAAASEAWVQEQANLTRQIATIQETLNPQRTDRARIGERLNQLESNIAEQTELLATTETEIREKQAEFNHLSDRVTETDTKISSIAQQLAAAEAEHSIQQETQQRLIKEQREKQRQLDKLEATQQAQQEVQGTYSSKIILNSNLSGVHGLVVQLAQVEPRYQLALETAAGGRLGCIVVEDDRVAAEGIELLKRQRGGRATFLPLNKIKAPQIGNVATMRFGRGFIDLAVNLVNCEARYREIFAYVFTNTAVFDNLDNARSQLGKHRIVTLEGEILEVSGAMTGGSQNTRSSLHFGNAATRESGEVEAIERRLSEIAHLIANNEKIIENLAVKVKSLRQELTEIRQEGREKQLHLEQLTKEIQRLTTQQTQLIDRLQNNHQERETIHIREEVLSQSIPEQELNLQQLQTRLDELEASHDQSEWQQVRLIVNSQEQDLRQKEQALREAQNQLKDVINNYQRLTEKISEAEQNIAIVNQQQATRNDRQSSIQQELTEIEQKIIATETNLQELVAKLGTTKQERDNTENHLRQLRDRHQKQAWQLEKLQTTQQERRETLQTLQQQIAEKEADLPDPVPEIPQLINEEAGEAITFDNLEEQIEQLQKEIRKGEKRLEAMEPVNMLALEEYEKTEARLQELSDKLNTIEAERTELLLRVEKFTTLRLRAFKESFDAVDANFQTIYAELSEGDGHLQLEDEEDPFNGGLNLVAHPKGKPVQRLSSMSGGEKSLTALGFIFSLQKYRPSPFYAFDEVDMFLDGANVEKLSRMVKKQAQEAQFIVVSLRRPMIEASERTIGVTQARGAHTQVLGIKMK
jgi:chromosome segregation protein